MVDKLLIKTNLCGLKYNGNISRQFSSRIIHLSVSFKICISFIVQNLKKFSKDIVREKFKPFWVN